VEVTLPLLLHKHPFTEGEFRDKLLVGMLISGKYCNYQKSSFDVE
jgi:hypothetical protein